MLQKVKREGDACVQLKSTAYSIPAWMGWPLCHILCSIEWCLQPHRSIRETISLYHALVVSLLSHWHSYWIYLCNWTKLPSGIVFLQSWRSCDRLLRSKDIWKLF